MILASLIVLSVAVAGLAWTVHVQAKRFSDIEQQWRDRERQLIDRLLKQAHVAPLEIQREKVLHLPDPESVPAAETWVNAAFHEDDIYEEIQHHFPEAARMTMDAVKRQYSKEWAQFEKRLREERTPLRVG